uniref:Glutamic acid-rich protein-like n=1 Tax=Crassostrea virginica TaxID=6565 RepID=A0A8B8B7D2_CRAVI|nr:glutamic acid-rich protein-like [Crassostrea virginica]
MVACEGGTSYQYDRFVNTCYSLKEVRRTWYQAQFHCQAEEGWLLDLSDQKKAEKLMKKFNNYNDRFHNEFMKDHNQEEPYKEEHNQEEHNQEEHSQEEHNQEEHSQEEHNQEEHSQVEHNSAEDLFPHAQADMEE